MTTRRTISFQYQNFVYLQKTGVFLLASFVAFKTGDIIAIIETSLKDAAETANGSQFAKFVAFNAIKPISQLARLIIHRNSQA